MESAAWGEIQRERQIIIATFSTPEGKKALEILKRHFYDKSTYTRGDQYHTVYQTGQQDVVGFILDEIGKGRKNDGILEDAKSFIR